MSTIPSISFPFICLYFIVNFLIFSLLYKVNFVYYGTLVTLPNTFRLNHARTGSS